jgi:hypothetical protein
MDALMRKDVWLPIGGWVFVLSLGGFIAWGDLVLFCDACGGLVMVAITWYSPWFK